MLLIGERIYLFVLSKNTCDVSESNASKIVLFN